MREVQKRISELKPFVIQMGFSGDYIKVDTQFKPKWVLLDTENIKYTPNKDGKTYKFYASSETTEIDEILDLIEEIINHNKEREEKLVLLKNKADELKNIFTNKGLIELKRLRFVIDEPDINEVEDIKFDELPQEELIHNVINEKEEIKEED
jgi:hypothetical protein